MSQPTDPTERLKPLGRQRLRILSCLGGDMRHLPQYLVIQPDEDVLLAFRSFVQRLVAEWNAESDPLTKSLLAAGRLLTGDLSGADDIIDNLPAEPFKRDHGAGHCLVAPVETLAAVLPLPAAVSPAARWLAGSAEQAALRTWFAEHRNELEWREREGDYVLR
jgi:hypothetical protein